MRILIADDNAALQEVLTEVVSGAGHTAEVASSIDSVMPSIGSFRPDMIFLDIDMEGGQGLTLLDDMQNSNPPISVPVVVIRSWRRQIPQDSSVLRGHIEKPFESSDILESIERIEAEGSEVGEAAKEPAETKTEHSGGTLSEKGVYFGTSYVLFKSGSDEIHDLTSMFDSEGHDVLIVTTRKRKAITEILKSSGIDTLTLSIRLLGGHLNIYGLGTMIEQAEEFIKNNERPVISIEDLNQIIERNGMNSALTAVHQLITGNYGKNVTFLVSVDPKGFTTKDREILLNHMTQYDPTGE